MTRWMLAGLAMVLALLPLGTQAQKPRVERPTYAVGDSWVLSDATYRLARLTRDAYVFSAAPDREIWLTRDLVLTYVKQGSETLEIQEPPRLSWPLEIGKRGVGRAIIRVASTSIEVYASWRVEAGERVTVAGGAFDALRIRYTFDPEIPGHSPQLFCVARTSGINSSGNHQLQFRIDERQRANGILQTARRPDGAGREQDRHRPGSGDGYARFTLIHAVVHGSDAAGV